jgi:hypothetical protein
MISDVRTLAARFWEMNEFIVRIARYETDKKMRNFLSVAFACPIGSGAFWSTALGGDDDLEPAHQWRISSTGQVQS